MNLEEAANSLYSYLTDKYSCWLTVGVGKAPVDPKMDALFVYYDETKGIDVPYEWQDIPVVERPVSTPTITI